MAFFRFNRDKRGYEHFFLVEPVTNRRGKTRTRVLYWYRTPPNVRVGRPPFDEEVQRALEKQNPTVVFDWNKIVSAPIPSAETEKWRDRRRAEKAEKAARLQAAHARAAAEPAASAEDADDAAPVEGVEAAPAGDAESSARTGLGTPGQPYHVGADQIRKRRRRRRGRSSAGAPSAPGESSTGNAPTTDASATTGAVDASELTDAAAMTERTDEPVGSSGEARESSNAVGPAAVDEAAPDGSGE